MAGKKKTKASRSAGSTESDLAVPQSPSHVTHTNEAASSVEFSRDAKGVGRWSIKLYGERSEMAKMADEIEDIDTRLQGLKNPQ